MIDVDNFDKWMGEPVLRKKYEDTHGITDKKEKEEETYRQVKMQAQIQMDLQKDLVKQVVDAMDERNKKKKRILWENIWWKVESKCRNEISLNYHKR